MFLFITQKETFDNLKFRYRSNDELYDYFPKMDFIINYRPYGRELKYEHDRLVYD